MPVWALAASLLSVNHNASATHEMELLLTATLAPPRCPADHLASHPMQVASQAMQYDAAPSTPLPACVAGLTPDDVLPGAADTPARQHYACVIAGLLYAATGGLDQARATAGG